jgi:hypothetical protein
MTTVLAPGCWTPSGITADTTDDTTGTAGTAGGRAANSLARKMRWTWWEMVGKNEFHFRLKYMIIMGNVLWKLWTLEIVETMIVSLVNRPMINHLQLIIYSQPSMLKYMAIQKLQS